MPEIRVTIPLLLLSYIVIYLHWGSGRKFSEVQHGYNKLIVYKELVEDFKKSFRNRCSKLDEYKNKINQLKFVNRFRTSSA